MISVCFSGGAIGADTCWHNAAAKAGHSPVHYSFDGHKINVKSEGTIILSADELKKADPALKTANKTLGRKIPFRTYVRNLLRRNFYQIEMSSAVYVIDKIKDGKISGGAAWASQMFVDRNFSFSDDVPLYVFDQDKNQWFQYNKFAGFNPIVSPPVPSGMYTGIGTRDINANGEQAISKLFED